MPFLSLIKYIKGFIIILLLAACHNKAIVDRKPVPKFTALVLYENGGHHIAYTTEAKKWLNKLAADSNFAIEYIQKPDSITIDYLSRFQLIIQLDYPPYGWNQKAVEGFQQYIEKGKGGWIGFHHATLLGEFDGYPMWQWFSGFMGGIRFKDYIADFASGQVHVEVKDHPCFKNVPSSFLIEKEEWYTYDKTPRLGVQVLASVDESSYKPGRNIKMGDHPVVWSNVNYPARNIYIFMGHSPDLFDNTAYTTLFRNAIFWAAKQR